MVRNEISLTSKPSFTFNIFFTLISTQKSRKELRFSHVQCTCVPSGIDRQVRDAVIWRQQVLIGWGYGAEKCYIALFSFLFLIVFFNIYLLLFRLPCEITMAESATI